MIDFSEKIVHSLLIPALNLTNVVASDTSSPLNKYVQLKSTMLCCSFPFLPKFYEGHNKIDAHL